ncbi:MAG TPA: SDR family NAD(P)-dependent oxidoreductase, partial [Phytomonospora sp.]
MSRAVLVTGASGGIGRAVARAFAASGDRVAVHYGGNRAGAEETLASLPGSGHAIVTGDIADPDVPPALVASTVDALGGIDVLVNNAALMVPHPIAEVSYEDWLDAWRRTAAVNLHGTANLSYCAAREMIARG